MSAVWCRTVDAVIFVTTVQQLAARCSVLNAAIAANVMVLQPAIAGTWYCYLLQVAVGSSGK